MTINLTLLIQIANFWITYQLLSRILLGALLRRLEKREELTQQTVAYLGYLERKIENLHQEKVHLFKQFGASIPSLPTCQEEPWHPTQSQTPAPYLINAQELENHLTQQFKP